MKVRFLHTADWQIGKRFGSVADPSRQETLRSARFQAIERLAEAAGRHSVDFVLVAGDLFDSPTVSKDFVSRALGAIGRIPAPVFAIPGNHDHGGTGSIWETSHFLRERENLAPNFTLLAEPKPHITDKAVIMPCPLLRRHTADNPLAWIRRGARAWEDLPEDRLRIVLAHGSIQEFGTERDPGEDSVAPNFLDLAILDSESFDYIALGDWHGTKQAGPKAWYSGTPEPDRFPKSDAYESGNVLLVEIAGKGSPPVVEPVPTGVIAWREIGHDFQGPDSLAGFEARLKDELGARVQQDALRFVLTGSLSLEDDAALDGILGKYEARTLRFDVRQRPGIQPSESEIRELSARPGDPLISAVAASLQAENDPVAIEATRQLFGCVRELETREAGGSGR